MTGSALRRLCAGGAALLVLLCASVAPRARAGATAAARPPIRIRVSQAVVGRAVPEGFLGLSTEFSSLYAYAGEDARAPNPVLTRLIANLSAVHGTSLRFGGDSADRTWWPVPGMATPPWATYTLTPQWTAVARGLAAAAGARLTLGINLLADSPAIASTEAKALLSGVGRAHIAAFEIGNEPELYATQAWYRTAAGRPVPGRSSVYDFRRYLAEVSRIRRVLPRMALAGPATGSLSWLLNLSALQSGEPGLKEITFHRYPLNRCVHNLSSALYPSISNLLSRGASAGLVAGMAHWIALAHRHRESFRVDELNAVTCGGMPGVSDTFASALWALDTEFWMLRTGVDGVDVHIHPGAPANQLFTFTRQNGRWTGAVRPQYYGLLMFARAAPAGARLLRLSGAGSGPLRAWATLGRDGRVRVVLINDSLTRATTVVVQPAARSGPASIERLQAPRASSKSGVTLGGQGFGARTSTGRLGDPARMMRVRLGQGGYRVSMPPASAAMLTLSGSTVTP